MTDLLAYDELRESGHNWLAAIPSHWACVPHRALFREIKAQGHESEQMLSVTIARGVLRQADLLASTSKKDSSNLDKAKYKLVEPGDIVYNKMRAWQGAVGYSSHRGIVSPAYIVQRLRTDAVPQYFHYLFRTPAFATEAERWSYGITSDQWSLRPEHFKMIYSCVPPVSEQRLIVRFVEHHDRQVGAFIRSKRRLIALLSERRRALISAAVTNGLDGSVAMRPVGLPWLDQVPAHWANYRLKHVASVQTGLTLGKDYGRAPLQTYPYLRVANVQAGRPSLRVVKTVDVPAAEASKFMLRPGDVLMTEGGDIDKLGRGCLWGGEVADCLHQNHIFAARCGTQLESGFLVALLDSVHGRAYFETTAKKTTNLASTNSTTLGAFPVFLPPLDEQRAILEHVEGELRPIDHAIARADREIELMREFRTCLVSSVVSGALDVRAVAVLLPEGGPEDLGSGDPDLDEAVDLLEEEPVEEEAAA